METGPYWQRQALEGAATCQGSYIQWPEIHTQPQERAILRFSVKLSHCPPAATSQDVQALLDTGLSAAEILDLVLSAALFGWANRLMHTLGEPRANDQSS